MLPVEAQQRGQERRLRDRIQREADIRAVMELPQGRRFVWDLLNDFGGPMWSNSGNVMLPNPNEAMWSIDGRKGAAADLSLTIRTVAPQSFVAMVTERLQAENLELAQKAAEAVPAGKDASRP